MPAFAYVANSNFVSVFDINTNQLVTMIEVEAIGLNLTKFIAPTADGKYLYVSNASDFVSVIDTCTYTVADSVTVGHSPEGIAISRTANLPR